ncbi:ionotropic receptor 75a-like [Phymastichus coffea]|uniref:ionotropic receptor 75a-like n=1 Tax=Phymastichus coffea TaxID=108790 RepID=UPI00273AFC16|nr:ionotropic receptor 75a-like [Phymastichus coffea]
MLNRVIYDLLLWKQFSEKGMSLALARPHSGSNIQKFANTTYWKLGILVDTRCSSEDYIASIFFNATNYRMYDELHYWFILGYNLTNVLSVVNDGAFGVSTDFVIAVPGSDEGYDLYDVYNPYERRGGMLNVTFYGTWTDNSGLSIRLIQMKTWRRADLHGLLIKAMFFQSLYRPPDMPLDEYYQDERNGTRDGRSKFGYHILTHLSTMFNFTLECIEALPWLANDSLDPLARAMTNMEVDITGTPLNINLKRTYLMKFLHEDWPFRTCFMFRNPQPKNIKIKEIFRPFADSVWFFISVFIGASLIILSITLHHDHREHKLINVGNSFTMIIGALCQQGTDVKLQLFSSRMAFLFILIFSSLMYNYYSACVVSARLDEPIIKINDSLNELIKLRLKMSSERMPYLENFFKTQFWEVKVFQKQVWNTMTDDEKFMEPEAGMLLVQRGGFAYHVHPDTGYTIVERLYGNREICELMEVHLSRPKMTHFVVTNNSTFAELVRVGLTKISEVGLRSQQLHKWQRRKPVCRKDILSATSIDIYEFAPHLIFMILGVLLALIIYIIEIKKFSEKSVAVSLVKLSEKSYMEKYANDTTSRLGIFLDIRCYAEEDVILIFYEATNYRIFDEFHDWLILGYNLSGTADVINDKAFGLSTNFIIAISEDFESFNLYDVYNCFKDRGGILNITFYGNWNFEKGFTLNLVQSKFTRRANLHGLKLRAMFFQSPYRPTNMSIDEYLKDYKNTTKDGRSKFGYITLRHLADLYNFTFESSETKKWEPGDALGPLTKAMASFESDIGGSGHVLFFEILNQPLLK